MLHEKHELGKRLSICLKAEENYKFYAEMRVAGRIEFIRIFFSSSETKTRTGRDMIKNVYRSSYKVPVVLV